MFDVQKAIEAQEDYCKENKLPHFAPSNGVCWKCHKNIYSPIEHERKNWQTGEVVGSYTTGIDVEKAGRELVTGCPHCSRSYCD
jgi:hypothetical protein